MSRKKKRKQKKLHEAQAVAIPKQESWEPVKAPFWQYLIPPAVISLLTIIFYAPSMRYAFQFDDIANIQKHFQIRHHTLKELFFSSTRWISYWLNSIHYSISQFNPISYRIGNLIIHITSGVLVFFILFTALRHLRKHIFFKKNYFAIALLSSLLFLLHPVSTQTVSYVIQGQLEGLAALSIFAMTFFFLKLSYAPTTKQRRLFTLLLFATAALSCGTKEIAIISPAILLVADWFLVAQGDWSSLKRRMYIHIPLALLVVGLYIYFLKPTFFTEILGLKRLAKNNIGNVITQNPATKITPWMFFRSQFKVILHYLWIFIWPLNISVEYDWVLSKSFFSPDCLFPFIALALIGIATLRTLAKNRASLSAFGIIWFFVAIAPRSSIIPSPELLVDYKTYTASFGWIFLISSALIFVFQYAVKMIKNPKPDSIEEKEVITQNTNKTAYSNIAFAMLLAIGFGFLTMQRNTVWRSGIEFWGNMIKNAPGKARAYNNYGVELSQNEHDFRGSIPYFKKAINMDQNYPDPWNNLSVAYANIGEIDDAINALKQSIRIYPYYPENYNNMASFYIQKKDFQEAEKLLRTALRLRPYYGKAYFNRGRIHYAKQEKEKAWECFKRCCTECDFDNVPHGFAIYGKVSMELKKYDDAIFAYRKALSFNPNYPDAMFNLANAFYMAKKYDNAVDVYNQIVRNNPGDLRSWYNLGETLVSQEKYKQALQCYKKAEQLKHQFPLLNIRLASCLQKLGKTQEAKNILDNFITQDNKGNSQLAQVQMQAQSLLAQIDRKEPGVTT